MKDFKVSLVGCGNISKTHLPILEGLEGVCISSVVDVVPERANDAAKKYNCRAFYDYDVMLLQDRPDCVHICTPHDLHVEMAVKALSLGVNVLCEKPCAITAEGLERLKSAAGNSSAVFGVCFQNRYNTCVKKAKELIDSCVFGSVLAVRANLDWFRDLTYYSDEWHGKLLSEGGGVLVNQAVHTEDLIRYLVGSKIKFVEGHVFNDSMKGAIEVEDTATVRYEFENGVIACLNATNAFPINADVTLDFYFETGDKLHIEGLELYHFDPSGGVERLTQSETTPTGAKNYWGNGHAALISDFYRCLRSKEPFPVDAYEGGLATEEFLAVYRSSESGNRESV